MDIRALRYFVEIARRQSVSRAADHLLRSQPAVSRKLQDLENELGLKLFDRMGRQICLTGAGQELLLHAENILVQAEGFSKRARGLATGEQVLRVGASANTIERVMPLLLGPYSKKFPQVEVSLTEANGAAVLSRLERGELDVAITRYVHSETFAARPAFPAHIVAVVSTKHRLAQRRQARIEEFAEERILSSPLGSATRDLFEQACKVFNIQPRVTFECPNVNTLIVLAAERQGVAIVPSTVDFGKLPLNVVALMHGDKPVGTWMSLVWNRRRDLPTYAEGFVQCSLDRLTKRYPGVSQRYPSLPAIKDALLPKRSGVQFPRPGS